VKNEVITRIYWILLKYAFPKSCKSFNPVNHGSDGLFLKYKIDGQHQKKESDKVVHPE